MNKEYPPCHHCLSTNVVQKGLILKSCTKQQRYKCKDCKRTFVKDGQNWFVPDEKKVLIDKALLERVSLRGIGRIFDVSLSWLLIYIKQKYGETPDDLGFDFHLEKRLFKGHVYIKLIDCQADELWSFVFNRKNVKYIWIALHSESRQIIALHVGDRSRASAQKLWDKIPETLKKTGFFHTDDWDSYKTVIPEERHEYSKKKKYTNYIERFNNTLRQRCSRLVRETLSFSKSLENHIAAIQYFCYHYNLSLKEKEHN